MEETEIINSLYFNKYRPLVKLGQGSFGKLYKAQNTKSKKIIAMKFEERASETNLLESEAYRLLYLKGEGIPDVISYGNDKFFNILVMELLNKTLPEFLLRNGKPHSTERVVQAGIEMIQRLKHCHDLHHVHRDVKPENFMNGLGLNENKIYLIDFGLGKKYRSSKTHEHIKYRIHKKMTGTIRYASINTSRYCGNQITNTEHSRRDDLESLGYVLIFMLVGSLPWQGLILQEGEDRCKKVLMKKKEVKIPDLCKGVPEYCRGLKYEEEPKYDYLISLLTEILEGKKISSLNYDFCNIKTKSTFSGKLETSSYSNPLYLLFLNRNRSKEKIEEEEKIQAHKERTSTMVRNINDLEFEKVLEEDNDSIIRYKKIRSSISVTRNQDKSKCSIY